MEVLQTLRDEEKVESSREKDENCEDDLKKSLEKADTPPPFLLSIFNMIDAEDFYKALSMSG